MTIRLRHTEDRDLAMVLAWIPTQTDLMLWSGAQFHWPLDLTQLRADLDRCSAGRRILWTALNDGGLPVGCASAVVSDDGLTGRFGRMLVNPLKRGSGYGRRIVILSVSAAFAETSVRSLTVGVFEHNRGSRELYESLGFRPTGVLFDSVVDGRAWRRAELTCARDDFCADPPVGAGARLYTSSTSNAAEGATCPSS